jgi:hypothetical protein
MDYANNLINTLLTERYFHDQQVKKIDLKIKEIRKQLREVILNEN